MRSNTKQCEAPGKAPRLVAMKVFDESEEVLQYLAGSLKGTVGHKLDMQETSSFELGPALPICLALQETAKRVWCGLAVWHRLQFFCPG